MGGISSDNIGIVKKVNIVYLNTKERMNQQKRKVKGNFQTQDLSDDKGWINCCH